MKQATNHVNAIRLLSGRGEVPTSERGKRRESQIIKVATEQFLKLGYGDTSLDTISKLAGGSKTTLYRFFPSKADLFKSVVSSIVANRQDTDLDPTADIFSSLTEFCCHRLEVVFAKQHWSLLKLIHAEKDRFPRIAEAYYQLGPVYSRRLMTEYLSELHKSERLRVSNPEQSANFFISALMHEWYLKYLYTNDRFPSKDEMKQHSDFVTTSFIDIHKVG